MSYNYRTAPPAPPWATPSFSFLSSLQWMTPTTTTTKTTATPDSGILIPRVVRPTDNRPSPHHLIPIYRPLTTNTGGPPCLISLAV